MLQPRGGLDLRKEPLGAEREGEFLVDDLDRDLAIVSQVVGEVDRGHATLAEPADDAIVLADSGGESGVLGGSA